MKIFLTQIIVPIIILCVLHGCAGLANPNSLQKVNNANGKIDEIRNNQDGFSLELAKLRQDQSVTAEKISGLQQGFVNQSNAGVQILQGSGGLILVFGLATIFMILHYRNRAIQGEKASDIMAKAIVKHNDPKLNIDLLKSASSAHVDELVYGLIHKHQDMTN